MSDEQVQAVGDQMPTYLTAGGRHIEGAIDREPVMVTVQRIRDAIDGVATAAPERRRDAVNEVIAGLLEQKRELSDRLRRVREEIDRFRVQCPTCRCRILPDTECACCADTACDEGGLDDGEAGT